MRIAVLDSSGTDRVGSLGVPVGTLALLTQCAVVPTPHRQSRSKNLHFIRVYALFFVQMHMLYTDTFTSVHVCVAPCMHG